MNGILLFVIGVIVGVVMLVIISCIVVGSDETSCGKQNKQSYKPNVSASILFATLVYCMSDCIDKDTVINYITNAIKISINKGWMKLTQDNVQIYECSKSLYEEIIKDFEKDERGDF